MRLLLVHQAFVSPQQGGGTRHYELSRYCVDHGHNAAIVTSDLNYLTGKRITTKTKLVTHENLDGIRLLRAYTIPTLHHSFVWRVVSFICFMVTSFIATLRVKGVDVVMGTSPPIFQAVSAWLAAKFHRCPFLLEIRDLWPGFAIDMGVLKNPILIYLSKRLERFLYSAANHIMVNSPAYKDYLLGLGIKPEKITVIANGVDATLFNPLDTGDSMRRSWNLEHKFVVVYTGALGQANDIPNILSAAHRLRDAPEIHFVLVGDGKDRMKLEAMAQNMGLPNVLFTGAVPKQDIPAVLAAADLCLATLQNIPMFTMTYPNKVFDYMAAGRPTVLAIGGVIRAVLEEAGGGVCVQPGDAEVLAAAIRRLAGDRSTAFQMGQASRAYVEKHFIRESQAHAFKELIERLSAGEI